MAASELHLPTLGTVLENVTQNEYAYNEQLDMNMNEWILRYSNYLQQTELRSGSGALLFEIFCILCHSRKYSVVLF